MLNLSPKDCLKSILTSLVILIASDLIAQNGGITFDPENGIVIRPPQDSKEWFRVERTRDFDSWEVARDSVVWPIGIGVERLGIEVEFYRFIPVAIPEPPYTIGIVGDSTAVGIQRFPLVGGWGQGLSKFTQEEARMLMAGEPGLSTKSFFGSFRERMLTTVLPAVVLVQLGQIDEFNGQPEIKSTTLDEYRENLSSIVSFIRGWGGIPILVSPLSARLFEDDGSITPYLSERSAAVSEVGEDTGAYVIDLNRLTSDLYSSGTQSDLVHWGHGDFYHLSVPGSVVVAKLVLNALPSHLRNLLFVEILPD